MPGSEKLGAGSPSASARNPVGLPSLSRSEFEESAAGTNVLAQAKNNAKAARRRDIFKAI